MTLLEIRPGSFQRTVHWLDGDKPLKMGQTVNITRPFLLGDREVSVRQFHEFLQDATAVQDEMPGDPPKDPDYPISSVSWVDAVRFCNWLSLKEELTPCYRTDGSQWEFLADADGYRLPTEAEWEYACRAGTTTLYCCGNEASLLDRYAVFQQSSPAPCGSKLPNGWGLFDMHGNVWELCHDLFAQSYPTDEELDDPTGPSHGELCVLRGGNSIQTELFVRWNSRLPGNRADARSSAGFRVARTLFPLSTSAP
jgi:formylglycine-generating enzyme required for sulfatase activity